MSTKYNWTTGPISASAAQTQARILVLNNTSCTRKAYVRIYDLSFTPKNRVFDESYVLAPFETAFITVDITGIECWEAQGTAYSKSVRFYVTGRDEFGNNTNGNTILNADFKLFGT
ncbi:MAG: hypothetical protein U9N81_00995 [Bacillota bacterium]|nr:hypothetical protein [Bacillota bacterium]